MLSFLFTANRDDDVYVDQEAKNLEYTNIKNPEQLEYTNFKDPGTDEVDFAAKELEETEDPPQINNKKENDNKNSHGEKNSTTGMAHKPIPPQAHKAENRETRTGILQNDFVFICKFLTYTCIIWENNSFFFCYTYFYRIISM